jgi:hypothetical protein
MSGTIDKVDLANVNLRMRMQALVDEADLERKVLVFDSATELEEPPVRPTPLAPPVLNFVEMSTLGMGVGSRPLGYGDPLHRVRQLKSPVHKLSPAERLLERQRKQQLAGQIAKSIKGVKGIQKKS